MTRSGWVAAPGQLAGAAACAAGAKAASTAKAATRRRIWGQKRARRAELAAQLLEAQLAQLRPARVRLGLVGVIGARVGEVGAADGAHAGTVLATDDLGGQRQRVGVARPPGEVELLAGDIGARQLLASPGLVDLAGVHGRLGLRVAKTAHARAAERRAEPQTKAVAPARHPRHVEGDRHLRRHRLVSLAGERQRGEAGLEVQAPALAGRQLQPAEVEDVGAAHISETTPMRAMLLDAPGQPLRAAEIAEPEPAAGQRLLRVRACGVCRTDLHLLDGEVRPANGHYPFVPGHQIVAERVDGGGRVGVPWLGWTDGECRYCTSGRENLCERARFTGCDIDGGFAEL